MTRTINDVLDAVGPRLKALRTRRGLTLAELSAATGISESTLSRLENGQRRANLELLLLLSQTYDVPLDDLVGAPRAGDPRVHLRPIHRHGMTYVPLTRRPGGIHAYKLLIPGPSEPSLQTHHGYEWLFVMNGRLRLIVGTRDLTIPPGEAAEFDATEPHWLGSADGGPVELLILFGLRGERAQVEPRHDPDGAAP
ncbi:helix-turn-helix domain-containing protein [Amycolatopsis benzoatilytica]|uniref:helix-turn-helix domain-containing protein n=1 Tax=Amycolatopsis benzoatilytica TaxID=346045 RepID=UPI000379C870|nr:XRE family transcriptional regulator [Amycolatopsis benzoatilytica]